LTVALRDPVVEEMRRIKEAHAARFNYDIRAMGKSLQEAEKRSGRKVVSYARKRRAAHAGAERRLTISELRARVRKLGLRSPSESAAMIREGRDDPTR
jgi:hypothetical protein